MSQFTFQTVSRETFLTRLDFRPKLLLLVTLTLIALVWESPRLNGLLVLTLTAACLWVGVRPDYLRLVFTVVLPLALVLLLIHGFFNTVQLQRLTGRETLTPLFSLPSTWAVIGGLTLTREGLAYGAALVFKTLAIPLLIPLLIFTTDINRMIIGLVRARVPYQITFIFASALRFFPLLFRELDQIIEAQRLRGLAVESLSLPRRIRVYGRIAVPLILSALVRSQQLEIVLQSRAFSGSPDRTYLHETHLAPADYTVMAATGILFLAAVLAYFTVGFGRFAGPF